MLNLFKRPIHKDNIDSWAKNLDDIAKVALLALPVVIYSPDFGLYSKIFHSIGLVALSYTTLLGGSILRNKKDILSQGV